MTEAMRRALPEALRCGYVPFMLLGICGGAVALIGRGCGVAVALGLVACAIAVSFVAERIAPHEPVWNRSHGDRGRDALHALVNEITGAATVGLIPLLSSLLSHPGSWPATWPFAAQVVLAVLVFDLGVTLAHWQSHRWSWLWRFHAVHHSVRRLYGFNGLMKHPVHQAIETTAGAAPLLLLGVPQDVALALSVCTAVQLLLQHSNVDYRLGPLRHVLAANHVHRFHHLRWAAQGDVNFGLFTTIWDRVLGTYRYDAGCRVAPGEIGIGSRPDYPTRYLPQLLEPFRLTT
jgi:sterol desaturase/sphingolipid hydroxylase (fatty acid hydroxylase superfamily)